MGNRTIVVQGVEVPRLGFGTWELSPREAYEGVGHALELGYRHIDTARMYGNEADVGRAITDAGLPRDEIFLVTKIWPSDHAPDRLRTAAEDSVRTLGTVPDLLLLHWPSPELPLEQTLHALQEAQGNGHTELIGVSNYPPELLRRALEIAPGIANDQVEMHPYEPQRELLAYASGLPDFFLTAYSPLATGRVARDPVIRDIAHKHGKTPGQVALRWLLDHDRVVAIPRSSNPQRRAENFDAWDFSLSDEERARIDALST